MANDSLINRQELFNELMVLLAVYPLFVFSDWQEEINYESVINTGWFLLSIIALNVLFNITIFICIVFKMI